MFKYEDALSNSALLYSEVHARVSILRRDNISTGKICRITGLHKSQLSSFYAGSLYPSYERLMKILERMDTLGIYEDNYYNITDEAIKDLDKI